MSTLLLFPDCKNQTLRLEGTRKPFDPVSNYVTAQILDEQFSPLDKWRFERLFPDGVMALDIHNLANFEIQFINLLGCKVLNKVPHYDFHCLIIQARETWIGKIRQINLRELPVFEFREAVKDADDILKITAAAILVDTITKVYGEKGSNLREA